MHPLYTYGYLCGDRTRVDALIAAGAILVDIRLVPRSRKPGFNASQLAARYGDAYEHCEALGNRNYKGGPIRLVDETRGIAFVLARLMGQPVILMCGCRDAATCHRTYIAKKLVAAGVVAEELR
jgi:uncharacterized protein (DUF488 family)